MITPPGHQFAREGRSQSTWAPPIDRIPRARQPCEPRQVTPRRRTRRATAVLKSPWALWEHLQAACARAATVADRAVGLWLARDAKGSTVRSHAADIADRPDTELSVQRALARAAATAYARRVRAEGLAPEQMLVLVKAATSIHGLLGFGAQALTSDIVRWSIDAYFED